MKGFAEGARKKESEDSMCRISLGGKAGCGISGLLKKRVWLGSE